MPRRARSPGKLGTFLSEIKEALPGNSRLVVVIDLLLGIYGNFGSRGLLGGCLLTMILLPMVVLLFPRLPVLVANKVGLHDLLIEPAATPEILKPDVTLPISPTSRPVPTSPASTPARQVSAMFVGPAFIDVAGKVRFTVLNAHGCMRVFVEIESWARRNEFDYQSPNRFCPGESPLIDAIVRLGAGWRDDCGRYYEANLVSVPDALFRDWDERYMSSGLAIPGQRRPPGVERLTHEGLTMVLDGPSCRALPQAPKG